MRTIKTRIYKSKLSTDRILIEEQEDHSFYVTMMTFDASVRAHFAHNDNGIIDLFNQAEDEETT